MARLPNPGQDAGTWGTILNDYLSQAHKADGTLKDDSVTAATLADDAITADALADGSVTPAALATNNTPSSSQVLSYSGSSLTWVSAGATPDATTSSKGVIQLAGDLGGTGTTAAAPVISDGAITNTKVAAGAAIAQSKIANLTTDLAAKEPTITAGATSQYYRGDKTWQTLDKAAVGLANVDNTSDANKPISTATQTALNAKADQAITLTAGTGLTGGGDLSANRTFAVAYGTSSGTAAQGNDSRITGAVQASTVTAKGDLLVATASATIARLGVGVDGQKLVADSTTASGVNWTNAAPNIQVFTSNGTWTKPANAQFVSIFLRGAGGGGGSGRRGAVGTVRCGGGGGGGAAWLTVTLPASILGATEAITVGVGGGGGSAVTADDTNGSTGTAGGTTVFGTSLTIVCSGGAGGGGGTTSTGTAGTGGQTGINGGGAGGAASTTGGVGAIGADTPNMAGGGGGAGGGITAADAISAGGDGARCLIATGSRSLGGVAPGGNGANGLNAIVGSGMTIQAGAGGASSITGTGGNGGNGGLYGCGGGGGGASLNGNNSGAGGAGSNGLLIVTTYF